MMTEKTVFTSDDTSDCEPLIVDTMIEPTNRTTEMISAASVGPEELVQPDGK